MNCAARVLGLGQLCGIDAVNLPELAVAMVMPLAVTVLVFV